MGPDNGCFTLVLKQEQEVQAYQLVEKRFRLPRVSQTFHGRDIFAPVAAHLSLGVPISEFGDRIPAIQFLPVPGVSRGVDGSLVGSIIHIDRFGNLITNIKCEHLTGKPWKMVVEVGQQRIEGLNRTYAEGEGLSALTGSSDHLEIAMKEGSASQFLGARVGDEVVLREMV